MAKFPTDVQETTVVDADLARTYAFLSDIVASSTCIPGIDSCEALGDDVYRFIFAERSTGPVSIVVRYTARYRSNGTDEIRFETFGDPADNTDTTGVLRLQANGPRATNIELRQQIAPDTPVPRLLQGLIRSFVQREASDGAAAYLANVRRALGAPG